MNIRKQILKNIMSPKLSLCDSILVSSIAEYRKDSNVEFEKYLWVGINGKGIFQEKECNLFEICVCETYELLSSKYSNKEKKQNYLLAKNIAQYIFNELEISKQREIINTNCKIKITSQNRLK